MKIKLPLVCSFLIVVFHLVGLTGFLIPASTELFLKLVPFHLLLMVFLLIVSQEDKRRNFWFFIVLTYLLGVVVEMVGTNTGVIFGKYIYGSTLGFKFAATPLLIGVNWVILIYSVGTTLNILNNQSVWFNSFSGALVMVVLDILIEPVAVNFNYWHWVGGNIPLQNYIAWFIFSFFLLRFFYWMDFEKKNWAGVVMLVAQVVFFIVLNIAVS